jgi:hypothetical protein
MNISLKLLIEFAYIFFKRAAYLWKKTIFPLWIFIEIYVRSVQLNEHADLEIRSHFPI